MTIIEMAKMISEKEDPNQLMKDYRNNKYKSVVGGIAAGAGLSGSIWAVKRLKLRKKKEKCGNDKDCIRKVDEEIKKLNRDWRDNAISAGLIGGVVGGGAHAYFDDDRRKRAWELDDRTTIVVPTRRFKVGDSNVSQLTKDTDGIRASGGVPEVHPITGQPIPDSTRRVSQSLADTQK